MRFTNDCMKKQFSFINLNTTYPQLARGNVPAAQKNYIPNQSRRAVNTKNESDTSYRVSTPIRLCQEIIVCGILCLRYNKRCRTSLHGYPTHIDTNAPRGTIIQVWHERGIPDTTILFFLRTTHSQCIWGAEITLTCESSYKRAEFPKATKPNFIICNNPRAQTMRRKTSSHSPSVAITRRIRCELNTILNYHHMCLCKCDFPSA